MDKKSIAEFNEALRPLELPQRIALIAKKFPDLVFTTSFGTEDQLITWAIIEGDVDIEIATHLSGPLLDYAQTLRAITQERYDTSIKSGAENGGAVWISGRSQHVVNADRSQPLVTWHADRSMLEIDPLADWSFEEVLQAVAEHEVPINPLFGAPAVASQPTTAPIAGEKSKHGRKAA
ncbi:MAG: phosphoadenosine phosphosulfate reductase family protein [Pseudomonadota bacterium]